MMPCCDLCYVKYINEDGTIDLTAVEEERQIRAATRPDGIAERDPDKLPMLEPMGEEYGLCRCDCHRKGVEVMH
jgi:hypothetical protein